jgi:hypothetical protein
MQEPFAILKITKQERDPPFQAEASLVGSGILVAPTLIVTCLHVFAEAFPDERHTSARCVVACSSGDALLLCKNNFIGADEVRDLALINLSDLASFDFTSFELADRSPDPEQNCVLRGYASPNGSILGCALPGKFFGRRWYLDIAKASVAFDSSIVGMEPTAHTAIRSRGESRKGLSGAPLIDVTTGQVIGMHVAGSAPKLPWQTTVIEPETVAIGADEIAAFLAKTPL